MENNAFPTYFRACGQHVSLKPNGLVMGILNVTPDSFSDGGQYLDPEKAIERVDTLIEEGADLIDIGGESTRPGALPIDAQEERRRLEPVLRAVGRHCTVPISIDTRKASVAHMALDLGAIIINDISALRHDPDMAKIVADSGAGVILMHMQGTPQTMQHAPSYEHVIREVKEFLVQRQRVAYEYGIEADCVILDPGIGFGKTADQNVTLISQCSEFVKLGRPVMVGVSNKSFIGKMIDRPVQDRLLGTAAAVAISIFQGTQIIRVHEVRQMRDVVKMAVALRDSLNN